MIRRAVPGDATAIASIWNPIIRDTTITFNAQEVTIGDLASFIETRPVFVLTNKEILAGFATYGPFRSGVGYRYVAEHTVMMAENARGQGGGAALMKAIEKDAKEQQVTAFWAGVSAENTEAIAFHEAIGFSEQARLPEVGHKFGRFLDLVLMQKRL